LGLIVPKLFPTVFGFWVNPAKCVHPDCLNSRVQST
jgi:hypothetical protein